MLGAAVGAQLVVSGNTGVGVASAEEAEAIAAALPKAEAIVSGDLIGHSIEAHFPFGVALAAGAIAAGRTSSAAVTSVGYMRGEGVAILEAA